MARNKLAPIYIKKDAVVVSLDNDRFHHEHPTDEDGVNHRRGDMLIYCDDLRCRAELRRIGGVECRPGLKFYYPLDVASITVSTITGTQHVHEPDRKTGEVSCSTGDPNCVGHFELDARLGLCSTRVENRPPTAAERDRLQREFDARVNEEAAIQQKLVENRRWDPFKAQQQTGSR